MSTAYVVHEAELPYESWDDPVRGRVDWRTMFSADGFPSDSFTGGIAYVAPNTGLSVHWHAPPEIYLILEGEPVVVIDGVEHPCRAGSAIFIPGNAVHGVRNPTDKPVRLFYCFAVDRFSEVEYHFPEASGGGI
jgi:mannose-6-phosphate isomerase-like protein (cupin superfamily)